MREIKATIHATGSGRCSLTGRETDGLTVTFDDGTVRESFLSWKAFRQLLGLKTGQAPSRLVPPGQPAGNGSVVIK